MDWNLWQYAAIAVLGVVAGVINILAGGGSNLILPVLMMFGIPPDIANGSNRVGVFLQSLTGIRGFAKAGKIPPRANIVQLLLPTLSGGLIGALLAARLPDSLLKPTLLLAMLLVAGLMLFKPNLLAHKQSGETADVRHNKTAWLCMFACGIYGGFVQAGVGLLMLPVLAGMLHYDAVRANALKIICTLGFTTVALLLFILHGQVWWWLGLTLAAGNVVGALIGVRFALKISPHAMRWVVFVMTLVAVVGALLK